MYGRIDDRPLVKNGEANIKAALNPYISAVPGRCTQRMKPSAMKERTMSLAIITRLRSRRSSSTPAMGPAASIGIARERKTPVTTSPEFGVLHRQAEHCDVIEVVADFADDLAGPREPVVPVRSAAAQ